MAIPPGLKHELVEFIIEALCLRCTGAYPGESACEVSDFCASVLSSGGFVSVADVAHAFKAGRRA